MLPEKLESMIRSLLPDAIVSFGGDTDCQFRMRVVSATFEGLSLIKRQQKIYEAIGHLIISGELHAISLESLTPIEAKEDPL